MTKEANFSDFAAAIGWPVVLVAANRLGCLNHTLLTVDALRRRGLPLAGLILNHLEEERDVAMVTNRAVLEERVEVPFLVDLMPEQDWLEEELVEGLKVAGLKVTGALNLKTSDQARNPHCHRGANRHHDGTATGLCACSSSRIPNTCGRVWRRR